MNYREKEKIDFTIKMLEQKVEKKKIRDENRALKTTVNKLKKIVGGTDD